MSTSWLTDRKKMLHFLYIRASSVVNGSSFRLKVIVVAYAYLSFTFHGTLERRYFFLLVKNLLQVSQVKRKSNPVYIKATLSDFIYHKQHELSLLFSITHSTSQLSTSTVSISLVYIPEWMTIDSKWHSRNHLSNNMEMRKSFEKYMTTWAIIRQPYFPTSIQSNSKT